MKKIVCYKYIMKRKTKALLAVLVLAIGLGFLIYFLTNSDDDEKVTTKSTPATGNTTAAASSTTAVKSTTANSSTTNSSAFTIDGVTLDKDDILRIQGLKSFYLKTKNEIADENDASTKSQWVMNVCDKGSNACGVIATWNETGVPDGDDELLLHRTTDNSTKTNICVDGVCLTKDDIKVIKGTEYFLLKSKDYSWILNKCNGGSFNCGNVASWDKDGTTDGDDDLYLARSSDTSEKKCSGDDCLTKDDINLMKGKQEFFLKTKAGPWVIIVCRDPGTNNSCGTFVGWNSGGEPNGDDGLLLVPVPS
jgi:hypothetical protein